MKLSPQQRAELRTCASCEWIYKGAGKCCPKCGFVSYGARWVYGKKAYTYAVTQKPWFDRKMEEFALLKLIFEIEETSPVKKKENRYHEFLRGYNREDF